MNVVLLYERAFWTLMLGMGIGLLLMAVGSGYYLLFLIQIGIMLQVLSIPMAYWFYRKGEKLLEK